MSTEVTTPPQTPGWTPDVSTFGARLALIRQRMGWGNIAKAAKECGVPTDSWRNWEVDGREPHRLTTIAMAIATRTGCDYLWLVHGPNRGALPNTRGYPGSSRVVVTAGAGTAGPNGPQTASFHGHRAARPVRQTSPMARVTARPDARVAV